MTTPKLAAGSAFPAIDLPVLSGGTRSLAKPRDGFDWQLTIVYRGKHCPLCTTYLKELNDRLPDFTAQGTDVLAVSADTATRAAAHMEEVAPQFDVAYGLTIPQMQQLGLYISGLENGRDVEAPFAEPGLFVIDDSGLLQITDISNVPFARPDLAWIAKGIGFRRGAFSNTPINGTHA